MTEAADILTVIMRAVAERERLPMWVLYDHPNDAPDHFVARLWHSLPLPEPTAIAVRDPDVEVIRAAFQELGFHKLDRSPDDEPHIMESWLI